MGAGTASAQSLRVVRLGYAQGAVSFSEVANNHWVTASLNRPFSGGEQLRVAPGGLAEVQDGRNLIRLGGNTQIMLLQSDSRYAQWQLLSGRLSIRVNELVDGSMLQIVTPNLTLTLQQPGSYRVWADPDNRVTEVTVRKGQAQAAGESAIYQIDAQQRYRFRGADLRDNEFLALSPLDALDGWSAERDRVYDNSVSVRYVSPAVVGYQDLDVHGSWRLDATYGNVWVPNGLTAGWAPYRDGHWLWIAPWGWTWIDNAPWGFAVSHYGRWVNLQGRWAWLPGPVQTRPHFVAGPETHKPRFMPDAHGPRRVEGGPEKRPSPRVVPRSAPPSVLPASHSQPPQAKPAAKFPAPVRPHQHEAEPAAEHDKPGVPDDRHPRRKESRPAAFDGA